MRDVAGWSAELLIGRKDAATDVSDHRGDVAGREDVASVIHSVIWRSNGACKYRACPYSEVRTSDVTCENAQKHVLWNIL